MVGEGPERASARQEYGRRLEQRRVEVARLARREARLSNARLGLFVLGAGLGVGAWADVPGLAWLPGGAGVWALLPALGFAWAVVLHDAARRAHLRARRAESFYAAGLRRLDHDFGGRGRGGEEFAPPDHPYALHLDLFGRGSLFELLSWAQTPAGEATLARWLLEPAGPDEIRRRNEAVAELRDDLDLREDLQALGPEVRAGLHPEQLARWGAAPPVLLSPLLRGAALGSVALLAASLAGWVWLGTGLLPALIWGVVQTGFGLALRPRVKRALDGVDDAARDLELLAELLARVEAQRFTCERLRSLRAALETEGVAPSARIRQLRRLIDLLDSRRNQMFAPLAPFLLWATQCALAIEAWRARCGPHLEGWIGAIGELEALADLAGYAYEHADDPFPELAAGEAALLDGEGLAHPLLPPAVCVRNDVSLGREPSLLVVSGSNMSGKSTLLRTLGTNVVLAQAGAPVRARRLRLSPLALGASLHVLDSLQEGSSHFWAEITTLRRIVALADGERPLLFLLDEILSGTNSHDRRIGAAAIVTGLVERGAIGLVTTHDLALARIADGLGPRADNVHFADELVGGELRFDYRLHPGVVERSNALELMREVGLLKDR